MGAFGGNPWGGGGAGQQPAVGTPLSALIQVAYRIAGIIERAMLQPGVDMISEAIPELNRMVGGWNCLRPNIFTIRIDAFNLANSQKLFTIGPGGDFDMPRPQAIQNGVIGLGPAGSNGLVRMPPMYQMDDEEWALISLQDIPNGVPLSFYYDGSFDTATGQGNVYLWPQTTMSYSVEWYTWQAIPTFSTKDDQVALPPGYEDAITYNLAKRLAALNPKMAAMSEDAYRIARTSLAAIESKNAPTPKMVSDYPGANPGKGHFDWRIGAVVR